jgi:transcriptional regulator NrdR family protein
MTLTEGSKMSDWVKIMLTLAGAVILFYSNFQTQSYRLDKLEKEFSEHLDKHEVQYKEIQSTLTEIKVELAAIASKK